MTTRVLIICERIFFSGKQLQNESYLIHSVEKYYKARLYFLLNNKHFFRQINNCIVLFKEFTKELISWKFHCFCFFFLKVSDCFANLPNSIKSISFMSTNEEKDRYNVHPYPKKGLLL